MGQQALEDLHAFGEAVGGAVDQATKDALDVVTGVINEAAMFGEEAARAAAETGDQVVDAVEEFVEQTADVVGEAAEYVADFLLGWIK